MSVINLETTMETQIDSTEYQKLALELADRAAREINKSAPDLNGNMPYSCQYVLELLIEELETRV